MEVGVCVEAYRQEAETHRRHINSAFMTFVVLDADDQPQILPWIRPQPGDGERRYREASARKKIRLDRCGPKKQKRKKKKRTLRHKGEVALAREVHRVL